MSLQMRSRTQYGSSHMLLLSQHYYNLELGPKPYHWQLKQICYHDMPVYLWVAHYSDRSAVLLDPSTQKKKNPRLYHCVHTHISVHCCRIWSTIKGNYINNIEQLTMVSENLRLHPLLIVLHYIFWGDGRGF